MRCQCVAGEKRRTESQLWGMSPLMFYSAGVRKQRRVVRQLVLSRQSDGDGDDAICFKVLITRMMGMEMMRWGRKRGRNNEDDDDCKCHDTAENREPLFC